MGKWTAAIIFFAIGTIVFGPIIAALAVGAFVVVSPGGQTFAEAWRPIGNFIGNFFARRKFIWKTSCALAFLSAFPITYFTTDPRMDIGPKAGIFIVSSLMMIVVWWVVLFLVHVFYRLFLAPFVDLSHAASAKFKKQPVSLPPPPGPSAAELQNREQQRRADQKRRENVRARVELFYNLHSADIGTRFTQKMFDDYVTRYMGDSHEAAYVAQRAEQLLEALQQCLDKVAPPPRFKSLADINQARQEERRMIREADMEDDLKEAQLIRLEEKYDEIVSRFFEEKGR